MALDLVVLVVCVNGYSSACGGADGCCSFFFVFFERKVSAACHLLLIWLF